MKPPKTDPFRYLGHSIAPHRIRIDPLTLIRAVNGFHAMGKEATLAAMARFARRTQDAGDDKQQSLFLVLRCLFEVPDPPGSMPPLGVGSSMPPEPHDPRLVPRFPLVLIEDIPLNLVDGYLFTGVLPSPLGHIAYFREHGRLRARPLAPPSRPLDVMARLEASPQWLWERPYRTDERRPFVRDGVVRMEARWLEEGMILLREQLLRLVASVYPVKTDKDGSLLQYRDDADEIWRKAVQEVGRMRLRWDPDRNDYVRT